MAKRKKNRNKSPAEVTNIAEDTEFASELTLSKKARKRAEKKKKKQNK